MFFEYNMRVLQRHHVCDGLITLCIDGLFPHQNFGCVTPTVISIVVTPKAPQKVSSYYFSTLKYFGKLPIEIKTFRCTHTE